MRITQGCTRARTPRSFCTLLFDQSAHPPSTKGGSTGQGGGGGDKASLLKIPEVGWRRGDSVFGGGRFVCMCATPRRSQPTAMCGSSSSLHAYLSFFFTQRRRIAPSDRRASFSACAGILLGEREKPSHKVFVSRRRRFWGGGAGILVLLREW